MCAEHWPSLCESIQRYLGCKSTSLNTPRTLHNRTPILSLTKLFPITFQTVLSVSLSMSPSLTSFPSDLQYLTLFSTAATILPLVYFCILQKYASTKKKESTEDPEQCYHEDWAWDARNFQGDDETVWHLQPLDTEMHPPVAGEPPLEHFGNRAEVAQSPTITPAVDRRGGLELERENSTP